MDYSIRSSKSLGLSVLSINHSLNNMYSSMEKLTSGYRINRASDDPAGLVISENLRSQIGSMNAEIRNISNNINKYETVSSTVMNLRSQLTELRSLAVAASNEGVLSEEAQKAYDTAAQSFVSVHNDTIARASYNGQKTLDGSEGALAHLPQLNDVDLSSAESAQASVEVIDQAISEVDNALIDIGSTQKNEFESRQRSLEVARENLMAAESQIRDTNYAAEYANFIGSSIRARASMAMLAHSALNSKSIVTLLGM